MTAGNIGRSHYHQSRGASHNGSLVPRVRTGDLFSVQDRRERHEKEIAAQLDSAITELLEVLKRKGIDERPIFVYLYAPITEKTEIRVRVGDYFAARKVIPDTREVYMRHLLSEAVSRKQRKGYNLVWDSQRREEPIALVRGGNA